MPDSSAPKPIVLFDAFAGWKFHSRGKSAIIDGVGVHHTLGPDPGIVVTSPVVHVEYDEDLSPIVIETRNSLYKLKTKECANG